MMSYSKVGRVPFSWENKPGVSKVTHHDCPTKMVVHDLPIPLPPCPFPPPSRSSSRKGLRLQEDPFLAAYKECTKSFRNGKLHNHSKKGAGSGVRKSKFLFSCKNSCDVRDDNLVRSSHLPPVYSLRLSKST